MQLPSVPSSDRADEVRSIIVFDLVQQSLCATAARKEEKGCTSFDINASFEMIREWILQKLVIVSLRQFVQAVETKDVVIERAQHTTTGAQGRIDEIHEMMEYLYCFFHDEMFEIITWNQLSIHDKRIFVLNTDGFYNHLLAHLQLLKEEEFLYTDLDECITVLNEPQEIVAYLV